MPTDHFSSFDYRKVIAWDKRLAREWAFLEPILATAPVRRVLDLGAATGEHARLFAGYGYEVLGIDMSDAMLERARESGMPDGVTLIKGDVCHVDRIVHDTWGAAVCLGNTLAHITEPERFRDMFTSLRRVLAPGAPLVVQILNYAHFVRAGQRSLPVTFVQDEAGDAIFLRVMTFRPEGRVTFTPSILRYHPDHEPALEVETSHNVELRAWSRDDVEAAVWAGGFDEVKVYGTMADVPFSEAESHDLVVVAR